MTTIVMQKAKSRWFKRRGRRTKLREQLASEIRTVLLNLPEKCITAETNRRLVAKVRHELVKAGVGGANQLTRSKIERAMGELLNQGYVLVIHYRYTKVHMIKHRSRRSTII